MNAPIQSTNGIHCSTLSHHYISSRIKNTKAEPSIVPSKGINNPMINVVVILLIYGDIYNHPKLYSFSVKRFVS